MKEILRDGEKVFGIKRPSVLIARLHVAVLDWNHWMDVANACIPDRNDVSAFTDYMYVA